MISNGDNAVWHKHNRESLERITRETQPLEECNENNKSFHDDTMRGGSSDSSSMGAA